MMGLWCGAPVELYDPGMYQFCDRCLANGDEEDSALPVLRYVQAKTEISKESPKKI